jgi:hypothetical protein
VNCGWIVSDACAPPSASPHPCNRASARFCDERASCSSSRLFIPGSGRRALPTAADTRTEPRTVPPRIPQRCLPMFSPMKYATLPLGLAILGASVVAAAAQVQYQCANTIIEFNAENGKIYGFSLHGLKPQRTVHQTVQVARDKHGMAIVRLNGKRCEESD